MRMVMVVKQQRRAEHAWVVAAREQRHTQTLESVLGQIKGGMNGCAIACLQGGLSGRAHCSVGRALV